MGISEPIKYGHIAGKRCCVRLENYVSPHAAEILEELATYQMITPSITKKQLYRTIYFERSCN